MNLFNRMLGRRRGSAGAAKERLQLVLVHDRAGLSPGKLEALKDDLIAAISRHVDIDPRAVDVSITKERGRHRLVADIPLAATHSRRR